MRRRVAWTLWGAQVVVSAVAAFLVWFRAMSIAACGQRCDFALLRQTSMGFALLAAALLVVTAGILPLARTRGWQWLIPTGGIAIVLTAAAFANHLSDIALLLA